MMSRTCASPLARPLARQLFRQAYRPLAATRSPNYLSILCSALKEVIRLDKTLVPYMKQQQELLADACRYHEVKAVLDKVYGPDETTAAETGLPSFLTPFINVRQLLKDEQALLKTQLRVADLDAKLCRNR